MKILRVKKSFRTGGAVAGVRGLHEGELVPDSHPLAKRLPAMFEPAEDYVARHYPELCGNGGRRGLLGRVKAKPEPPAEPVGTTAKAKRPPSSGPGSGVDAWRHYAAEVTESPVESWSTLSRDEIIELLDSEGAEHGQE